MTGAPRSDYKVGLALGGGVARGVAHLGILHVLEQEGIPIDMLAGASAGALVGAMYSAGVRIERIRDLAQHLHWWQIARPVWPRRGLVSFAPLGHWLDTELGGLHFHQLSRPLAVAALDLESGEAVHLCQGRLAPAVQASCSVPGFVEPVEIDGRLLGDGSLVDTVPVRILRQMGADFVIGVDIFAAQVRRRWGPLGMGLAALECLVQRAGGGIDLADCLIAPPLGGYTYLRFSRFEDFYRLGEQAARTKVASIRAALGVK